MAYISGVDRNQLTLFPDCVDDYISEDSIVRVIDAYVDTLDFAEMEFTNTVEVRPGASSYHPANMTKLYLYGYTNGIRTSRKLRRQTQINVEVMWLMGKLQPDHWTISNFRKENRSNLKKVFKDFSNLCNELGLYGKQLAAIDGSKFKANNSKKNNYTQKRLDRKIKDIDEKVEKYLKDLDLNDSKDEDEITYTPKEIQEKIEKLKERKKKYKNIEQELKDSGQTQISIVDPDSRLMENKKNGLEMAYNVQTVVDSKHKLIADFEITQNPSDQGNLNSMSQKAKEAFGLDEKDNLEILADKGYYNAKDLIKCDSNNTTTYVPKQTYASATKDKDFYHDKFKYDKSKDVYVCPAGQELKKMKHRTKNLDKFRYRNPKACNECESKGRCTKAKTGRIVTRVKEQDFLDTVDSRTRENMDKYLQRQEIVEHPFGTIKRTMNAGYYLCRGIESVEGETSLALLAYNLKRVITIFGVKELMRKISQLRPSFSC